jgi:two-component system, chemotaxis family, sensor kinase CheA
VDHLAAIRDTFFQECEEQLAELESGLLAMEAGATDSETINAVFRAVHSVKGGAGAFSLDELVRFAHGFETVLDEVRAGRLEPTADALKVMLRAADVLADLVRSSRDGGGTVETETSATELRALLDAEVGHDEGAAEDDWGDFEFKPLGVGPATPEEPAAKVWQVSFRPRADLYAKANESALLLRELRRLGEIEVSLDTSSLPSLPDLDPEAAYLAWTITLTTEQERAAIVEVFDFVDGDCDLSIEPLFEAPAESDAGSTDAGDLDIAALIAKAQSASPAPEPEPTLGPEATPARIQESPAPAPSTAGPTIRVDLDRVDRLIDLVGELVINQAMLSDRKSVV